MMIWMIVWFFLSRNTNILTHRKNILLVCVTTRAEKPRNRCRQSFKKTKPNQLVAFFDRKWKSTFKNPNSAYLSTWDSVQLLCRNERFLALLLILAHSHCYFKPQAYAWQILSEAHQWQQDKIVVMSSCLGSLLPGRVECWFVLLFITCWQLHL